MVENDIKKGRKTMQTVDRALEIINLLTRSGKSLSANEISKALDLTRTSTYLMLNSLMQEQYIEKSTETGGYFLGYRYIELGEIYQMQYPFTMVAEQYLQNTPKRCPHQCNISIIKEPDTLVILTTRDAEYRRRFAARRIVPAHTTASGKLLMAFLPIERITAILPQISFKQYGPNTVMSASALETELESIRTNGYATEREELFAQKSCVAAPILDAGGHVIASISFAVLLSDFNQEFESLRDDILSIARSISAELGYQPF